MLTYSIATGELRDATGVISKGYSGMGIGRNNPTCQTLTGVGPIPEGCYRIGKPYDHAHLGPLVMNLEPLLGTNTFGRSLFRIHGDNKQHDASHGCIVIDRTGREWLAANGHNEQVLKVVQ